MILLLSAVIFVLILPYIRFIFKRVALFCRIKNICRKHNLILLPRHFFWFLGNTCGEQADFMIETPREIFSVKLCGVFFRKQLFNFIDSEHYSVKELQFQIKCYMHGINYVVKQKKPYNLRAGYSGEKEVIPIILMNPIAMTVTKSTGTSKEPVANGDYVNEGYFYNCSGFCDRLKEKRELLLYS